MIHIVHLGSGNTYAQEIRNRVRRINTKTSCDLQKHPIPVRGSHSVVIDASGEPLTSSMLRELLTKEQVTFFIGDSDGIPENIRKIAHQTLSVSAMPLSHLTETLILTEAIEKNL